MSLIQNEQVKLTATYVNGVAIAMFAVGGLAPIVALFSGSISITPLVATLLSTICVAISAALHAFARRHLRRLLS